MKARVARWSCGVVAMLVAGCRPGGEQQLADTEAVLPAYMDPPPVRSFPSPPDTIDRWIQAYDTVRIRQHAWDMWESINWPTPGNPAVPVWQTWYAGHEIFEPVDTTGVIPRRRPMLLPVEFMHQARHGASPSAARIPIDTAERWFSFNRFTHSTASFIYQKGLWRTELLADTNAAFDRLKTPVAAREVLTSAGVVDAKSIVLKPVFQFIQGSAPTCVPYWAGTDTSATSNPNNPIAITWKQFVVVDPTGTIVGPTVSGSGITGCDPTQTYAVAPLASFYNVRITASMAANFSGFADSSGDNLGAGNDTSIVAVKNMVKAGNVALLVAMHVTGKEIKEWTWQTFWWSPTPNDSLGFDRPSTIGAPWNNYQMNTAYYMVQPQVPLRRPAMLVGRVAFNPYLETSLCQSGPPCLGQQSWYGPSTNCMSCHRMATFAPKGVPGTPYVPAEYIDKGAPGIFGRVTKTDFLWSVAIRNRPSRPAPAQ